MLTPGRDDAPGARADIRKMTAASPQTRGLTLILEHCSGLTSEDKARPAAVARLRLAIGGRPPPQPAARGLGAPRSVFAVQADVEEDRAAGDR